MARKRTSDSFALPAKRRKGNPKDKTGDNDTGNAQSSFLELPGELRNEIYALICGGPNETAYLDPRSRGNLAYNNALLRVNRQIRDEFRSVAHVTVPKITARVKNFDFGHVITFFNRCDDIELESLPHRDTRTTAATRRLEIVVYMTGSARYFMDKLRRWVNRSVKPEKKGTQIKVQYRLEIGPGYGFDGHLCMANMLQGIEDDAKAAVLRKIMRAWEK